VTVSVKWHGDVAKERTRAASVRALHLASEHLLEAANRTVPLEEDTLERSGKASVDVESMRGIVSYDTPYARRQHEDLTLHHAQGRRAKWLQRALDERANAIHEIVAQVLRGAL